MELILLAAFFVVFGVFYRRVLSSNNYLGRRLDRLTLHLKGFILVSTQDSVNAVVDQLRKAQAEIVAKLADVQAQLAAAGVAEQVDLSALTAAAQALDDIVADPAVEAPVEEAPAAEEAAPAE